MGFKSIFRCFDNYEFTTQGLICLEQQLEMNLPNFQSLTRENASSALDRVRNQGLETRKILDIYSTILPEILNRYICSRLCCLSNSVRQALQSPGSIAIKAEHRAEAKLLCDTSGTTHKLLQFSSIFYPRRERSLIPPSQIIPRIGKTYAYKRDWYMEV